MSIALIENFYLQCLWNFDFQFRNQSFVRFAIFTRISMTGTSVRTPTVVANAAGDDVPNRAIATETASEAGQWL